MDKSNQDTIGLLVHSYNNYLSGVMGFTELALMECEQEVVKERLGFSLESANEAVVFGKQLLSSISRLQVKLVETDINLLLSELAEKNTEIKYDQSNSNKEMSWLIKTDKSWFLFCLQSLVEFCQDYSKQKEIKLNLSHSDDGLLIKIYPNIQFTKEQIEKLFIPFYSSRTLLGKKDIGLAMLKGFLIQMGGDIRWSGEEGFVVEVPKASN